MGTRHPYVGYEDNGVFACSGTLLSPTVMLTAAHCFSDSTSAYGNNTVTGAPIVRVSFDPNLINTPSAQPGLVLRDLLLRSAVRDRCRAAGCPGFDTHDIAVIIFGSPGCHGACRRDRNKHLRPDPAIPRRTAALPPQGLVDTLEERDADRPRRLRRPELHQRRRPVRRQLQAAPGRRVHAVLRPDDADQLNDTISSSSSSCTRTSAGPASATPAARTCSAARTSCSAINSFVANGICAGNTYSYRVDTADALNWVTSTVSANGGSLSP